MFVVGEQRQRDASGQQHGCVVGIFGTENSELGQDFQQLGWLAVAGLEDAWELEGLFGEPLGRPGSVLGFGFGCDFADLFVFLVTAAVA
jgi:hypothetical protein